MSDEIDTMKWLWTTLMIPITWLWHRVAKTEKVADDATTKSNENRVYIAEHFYRREEVHDLVDRAVSPIHDKLDEIRDDIKYLVRDKKDK